MGRTATKTKYTPIYPQKYKGKYPIVLKSSWEVEFATRDCDMNSSCVQWSYEPWQIPYSDPTKQSQSVYVPDFLITFLTPQGKLKTVLVEIKPLHEALSEHTRNPADILAHARNMAKWQAAIAWCERRGIEFKVLTEAHIFKGADKIQPPKRKRRR